MMRRSSSILLLVALLTLTLASCTDEQRSSISDAIESASVSLPSRSEEGPAEPTETATETSTATETQTETATETATETSTATETQGTETDEVTDQAQRPDEAEEDTAFPWWLVILGLVVLGLLALYLMRRAANRDESDAWRAGALDSLTDAVVLGDAIEAWLSAPPVDGQPDPPADLRDRADRLDERLAGLETTATGDPTKIGLARVRSALADVRTSLRPGPPPVDRDELVVRLSTFRTEIWQLRADLAPAARTG